MGTGGYPATVENPSSGHETPGQDDDVEAVTALLGREPRCGFRVVVRDASGGPVVIENEPLLHDGTPMPTRYWLVGAAARSAVGRIESEGGVRRAEREVDPGELTRAHQLYSEQRDRLLPPDHHGPRPTGGVGGTRTGVKCLHAHYAWYLAGGPDPVGRWVADQLSRPTRESGGGPLRSAGEG